MASNAAPADSVRRPGTTSLAAPRNLRLFAVVAAIAAAWTISVLAEITGTAVALHHHSLIEGGPPLWVALGLFLVAWQVMVGAMMLPASLPAVRAFDAKAAGLARPAIALVAFLAAYAAVWTAFGLGAFLYDVGLHRFVDATPWLQARPWLIESSAVVLAGIYQFMPIKRRALASCRHPLEVAGGSGEEGGAGRMRGSATAGSASALVGASAGLRHGIDCLVCSWPMMLLMFAAGFANLWWMAGLAGAMTYETTARRSAHTSAVIGWLLLAMAALIVVSGWIPAFIAT